MIPKIHIVRTPDGLDFPLPGYSSKHHFGLNLLAGIPSTIKMNPGERVSIPTGFAIALPDGLVGQIVSVPKLARDHGIIVADAPSVVNPADRSALFILLQNTGQHQYILKRGTHVASLIISPAFQVAWQEVKHGEVKGQSTNPVVTQTFLSDAGHAAESVSDKMKKSARRGSKSIRDRYAKDED